MKMYRAALHSARTKLSGFTVVELLVAIAISLLLLAGVMTLFAHSRTGYERNDRLAQIQENGRFALEMIARDVRAAGYWGCAKRTSTQPLRNVIQGNTGVLYNFNVPVEGFEATSTSAWSPTLPSPISTDSPIGGNDILVVRGPQWNRIPQMLQANMASGTDTLSVVQNANYQSMSAGNYAIAANCLKATVFKVTAVTPGSSGTPDVIAHTSPSTPAAGDNSTADLGNLFYTADMTEVFPVQTTVYFVKAGTIGNSLYRRVGTVVEEVIPGVDSFQVKFGIDTNADHLADDYVLANAVTSWDQVVSVQLGLLVRSLDSYGPDTTSRTYNLLGASTSVNDRVQRQMFITTATLRNRVF
jgi:type IV pilus assembly protein PilW